MNVIKRNQPHYAVDKKDADEKKLIVPKGYSISVISNDPTNPSGGYMFDNIQTDWLLIPVDKKKILYDGRYTAVSGYVFSCVKGKWYVLANKRGDNTPDYQHCWNIVCGFLEGDESGEEGIKREIYEETGYLFDKNDKFKLVGVETEPGKCNNGNVSLRYAYVVNKKDLKYAIDIETEGLTLNSEDRGGEEKEVEDVKWIQLKNLDEYEWAFNHRTTIPEVFSQIPFMKKLYYKLRSYI